MAASFSSPHDIFWGLKDDWWKQIYDGKHHQHGPEVFDKGLHKRTVEPGYYASIKKACEYASTELGKPPTIELYKTIHSIACSHFESVSREAINVDPNNREQFRAYKICSAVGLIDVASKEEAKIEAKKKANSFFLLASFVGALYNSYRIDITYGSKQELSKVPSEIKDQLFQRFENSYEHVDTRDILENGFTPLDQALERAEQISQEIISTQKRLGLSKHFASFWVNPGAHPAIQVTYRYDNPEEIEAAVKLLFDDYQAKLAPLPAHPSERSVEENELVLRAIAELFQNLEWLHPFYDGQGRTDLVLLAKFLSENGFNPAILYSPYFSTYHPLDSWIEYLKEGIEAWKKEQSAISKESCKT